ncbi:predicted protein [Nematostella vectensis]|uniref:G-protein coupled receptors family 1 profile domain-containing protein n=1 Tax=Nematostella vectensis TaxID=45351 RepID=A7SD53_NEMVE|nr:predicted protein [Nematostella vectensis]|eukprot:XP_001630427.1 predicted protein [Nematostella vectensis]
MLSFLMVLGFLTNGSICALFVQFKSMRNVVKLGLVFDLAIVELLDVMVNIPLFMDYYLFTKKRNLTRETSWYTMLFHRFFLLNDLFTQLGLSIDCFFALRYGHRYNYLKTTRNITCYVVFKWVAVFLLFLGFSIPLYADDPDETVPDETYQRVLFGPEQIIWKVVIPCTFHAGGFIKCAGDQKELPCRQYALRYESGRRRKQDSSKALLTLAITIGTQTVLRLPAISYSYIGVRGDIEGDRWYAFYTYFFLFAASSLMPIIFYCRTNRFRRALIQFMRHPLKASAFLDHAASMGVRVHRNGQEMAMKRIKATQEFTGEPNEFVRGKEQRPFSTTPSRENTIDTTLSRENITDDEDAMGRKVGGTKITTGQEIVNPGARTGHHHRQHLIVISREYIR